MSLIFYSWWSLSYLPLIFFSIIANYFFTKKLRLSKNKKLSLFLCITFNVFLLLIFKYLDFIILNINFIFNTNFAYLNLPFPLAISFITFQTIAFIVNYYDNEIEKIKFIDYALFISFFPQLVAGPIVKYNFMVPQFNKESNKIFNLDNFKIGLVILSIGLFKKVILANNLGIFVDNSYENVQNLDLINAWLASVSFTLQIYYDFSGYVDMATGSALMLNIILPINFNSPYKSKSIIEFWQRWHITLSDFLTNYIYMPLLKNLKKILFYKSMLVVLIVFLIAGLWHGPSWNFVIFGFLHGVGLIVNHIFRKYIKINISEILSWILTFLYVNISFIFFRIQNFEEAITVCKKLIGLEHININSIMDNNFIIYFLISIIMCLFFSNSYTLIEKNILNKAKE